VCWVISVYFNIRNTLPKSGTFIQGHPVYIYIYIYIYQCFGRYIIRKRDKSEGFRHKNSLRVCIIFRTKLSSLNSC